MMLFFFPFQRVLETNRHHCLEIEIRPVFLIPDTNCFIDHLPSLQKLITEQHFTMVIPLVGKQEPVVGVV